MPEIDLSRIPPQLVLLAASLVLLALAMALDLSGAAGIAAGLLATLGVLLAAKAAAEPARHDGLAMTLFGLVVVGAPFVIAPLFPVPLAAFVAHALSGGAILIHARFANPADPGGVRRPAADVSRRSGDETPR